MKYLWSKLEDAEPVISMALQLLPTLLLTVVLEVRLEVSVLHRNYSMWGVSGEGAIVLFTSCLICLDTFRARKSPSVVCVSVLTLWKAGESVRISVEET